MLASNDDLSLLIDAARASGDIARRFFNQDPETWDKGDGAGPVTEADLAIDKMLRSELLRSRPDYGWLSEETEDSSARLTHDQVFIVDPIDGTRAFIAGEKTFSHSLAIATGGVVTAAVVFVPMLDRLYAATPDRPAQLNGDEIAASPPKPLEDATLLAAKTNMNAEHWDGGVPPVHRKFRPSLAYRLCLVAEGRFDGMLTLRDCWEWDIAAGDLIVRQAGGRVTDRDNRALKFNNSYPKTKGCHAGSPWVHSELQARLKRQ